MPIAFTRAVSPRLAECELTHLERTPIDPQRAAAQHAAYEQALQDAGFAVVRLPELPEHPDGVFVEDTALLLDGHAVILRPGAATRAPETRSTEVGLARHFAIHRIGDGFVDGGDALRIDRTLYVGASTRTNTEGIGSLRSLCRPLGFEVVQAELRDCLHLKTGATLAGEKGGTAVLLYNRSAVDPSQFEGVEPLAVDPEEADAANCLWVGDRIILPAGSPRTAQRLRSLGFNVVEVDVSELQKAEAGVTCMSLIAD